MDAALVPGAPVVMATITAAEVTELLVQVTDPEIPVLTIADIGILRDVSIDEDGRATVTITPTYSGCPAMEVIEGDIVTLLADHGIPADVVTVYSPAWTTEWMTPEAKAKLAGYGIAPPGAAPDSPLGVIEEVLCPQCASAHTTVVSQFGSTACKRLMVCTACGEPFDQFKAI